VSNGNRVMPTLSRPGCMSEDEWHLWSQSNANTAGNRAKSPCTDCPWEWLVARLIDGTCHPTEPRRQVDR
jgi:hypothetical protein